MNFTTVRLDDQALFELVTHKTNGKKINFAIYRRIIRFYTAA